MAGSDDDVRVVPPDGVVAAGRGDAEVDQHQPPVVDEQVAGLDVAVHDAGRVHRPERGEQPQAERGDDRRW
jgi:hypothetical protein